jgi:CAAX protease family protein
MASGESSDLVTGSYIVGSATSVFSISELRLRFWPIVATIALGFLVLLPSALANSWAMRLIGMERSMAMPWLALYANHLVQLLVALLLIGWLSKGRFGEYGLQWPKGQSYAMAAIAWGFFFGVLMTIVDYFPQILAHTTPRDLPLTALNLAGWLSFEGLFVGFAEEIPFRGLMQTFLMKRTSGRVRFLKFDMHVAGVILALLFALAHVSNFWERPFWFALAQQGYALALGILYAYWYEKSGSLLASIVGHNVGDVVEYALMFLMAWLWR